MPRHESVSPPEEPLPEDGRLTPEASAPRPRARAAAVALPVPSPQEPAEPGDDLALPMVRDVPQASVPGELPIPRAVNAPRTNPTTDLDPVLAALMGLFLPGLPQILSGQVTKGAAILLVAFVSLVSLGICCPACCVLNPLAAVDAWQIASRRRRGEPVDEWQFF